MDRTCIYARESSDDTNKAPPIEEQIKRCNQYAQEKGLFIVEVYQDNGYSGGDWKRPAWNKLVNDARGHLFKIVLVWNMDRIARDTEQFLWFQRNLKESYVKVISLTEGEINLDSVGDTAKNISIAMANEIFRKITSEKVKKAYSMKKKLAEKKGERVEWGSKPLNLDIDKIIALRRRGLGYRMISREIGVSYQTIRRALLKAHNKLTQESNQNNEGLQNKVI